MSPTMARPKSKRRVHKDQLGLAVKKSFNSQAVTESDVIVDWLYKSKHQGMAPDPCSTAIAALTETSDRQGIPGTIRPPQEVTGSLSAYTALHFRLFLSFDDTHPWRPRLRSLFIPYGTRAFNGSLAYWACYD